MRFPKIMLIFIYLIFMMVMGGRLNGQTHFVPPDGNPYSPMNIYVIGATYVDGNNIIAGTEVGLFGESRPDRCVGAAVLTGAVNPANPVEIKAHKDDGENNGFLEGDNIIYRLWDPGIQREYELSANEIAYFDPATGNSIEAIPFNGLGTAAVALNLNKYLAVCEAEAVEIPTILRLLQNYPNPFNPSTTIAVDIPERMNVRLEIFDVKGQLVNTLFHGELNQGTTRFMWNGMNSSGRLIASGIYFYKLTTPNNSMTKKMLFQK